MYTYILLIDIFVSACMGKYMDIWTIMDKYMGIWTIMGGYNAEEEGQVAGYSSEICRVVEERAVLGLDEAGWGSLQYLGERQESNSKKQIRQRHFQRASEWGKIKSK